MRDIEKEMESRIDHRPAFKTSPKNPIFFASIEDRMTGETIETHIHLSMDELFHLIRQSLNAKPATLTIGYD